MDNIGVMFLAEVALGRECHIDRGDGSLTRAPDGYDCIVARGRTEPGRSHSNYGSQCLSVIIPYSLKS